MVKTWSPSSVALWLCLTQRAVSIPTIVAKGAKLFYDNGTQFYNKGIAYQLTENDPLADPGQCSLDAALMQTLGANAIRVYHVDPTEDHDACMQTFSDAGIYAWIDLDTTGTYITGPNPQWTQGQYSAYSQVMDAFHAYDNVAGFFVGNEQLTVGSDSAAAPYLKAAARDMKAYRDSQGYRNIPIGYSAADVAVLRPNLQNYLACGGNASETVDFYALNAYEWCGESSYTISGYNMLEQNATGYNLPIFFSETGCNTPQPRTFDDQAAILGSEMDDTWSGAIVYEWIEETNNYGLISYGPPAGTAAPTGAQLTDDGPVVGGFTRQGTPTPKSPDFPNLSSQWATLSPTGINSNDYTPSNSPPACPSYTAGAWEVSGNAPLPTLGQRYVSSSAAATGNTASSTGAGATTTTSSAAAAAATAKFARAWSAGAGLAGMGAIFIAL